MLKFYKFKRCFVRQLTRFDCGLSSLAMILKYVNRGSEVAEMRRCVIGLGKGVSLYDLKTLGNSLGLKCKCVELSVNDLIKIDKPLILHMKNDEYEDHFQVYFGSYRDKGEWQFLIADPASYFQYRDETEIRELWQSGAALYIDDLPTSPLVKQKLRPVFALLKLVPNGLWFVLPLLNLITLLCGFAISWVLQAGFTESLVSRSNGFVWGLPVLLCVIGVFRSLFLFIRQSIVAIVSSNVYSKLTACAISRIFQESRFYAEGYIGWKRGHTDVQKIQMGMVSFLSVFLTDGTLIVIGSIVLAYLQLYTICVICMYLIIGGIILINHYPKILLKQAGLQRLVAISDLKKKLPERNNTNFNHEYVQIVTDRYQRFCHDYAQKEKDLADRFNRLNLMMEITGTVMIILIFVTGFFQLKKTIGYLTFALSVIIAYLIATVFPRLSTALFTICDTVDTVLQHVEEF